MKQAVVQPITNMMIMITNQCNLRCPYCFVHKNVKRMTYDTLFQVIQFLIKNAEACGRTPRMVFFGGEPMLEWDTLIVPIVQYIREEYRKPFIITMTTNVTLLNDERLTFMRDNQISALYSVDGDYDTTAINRPFVSGHSAFRVIDENIDRIISFFPAAASRITLNRATMSNFFEDLLYVTRKGFGSISVLPNLFDVWGFRDEKIFREQLALYGDWLIENFREGKVPVIFQQYSEMFFKLVLRNRCIEEGRSQILLRCHGCGKCGFGLGHHATCDTEGNIYGCLHLDSLSMNNIFYLGNIKENIDPSRVLALVERCDNEPKGGLDCGNCVLAEVCDRGCVPNNYLHNGSFNTPPPIFCQFYRAIADDALRITRTLGEEKNKLFKEVFQRRVMEG